MKQFIRNRFKERGKTVTGVASELGISRQALHGIIGRDMHLSVLWRLMDCLGFQVGVYDPETGVFLRIEREDLTR